VEQDRPGRRFKRVAGLDVSDAHPGIGTRNPGPIEDEPIWVIDWDAATFQIGAYTGVLYIKPGK